MMDKRTGPTFAVGISKTMTMMCVLAVVITGTQAQAQGFSVIHTFTGAPDAGDPFQMNLLDMGGVLYGGATAGGTYGAGAVFKLSTSGKERILYSFTGGADGSTPDAGLTADTNRNVYGTATFGGDLNCSEYNSPGCGVVFKVDQLGHISVLHTFTGGADGAWPQGVVLDAAGNLYGPAYLGGDVNCGAIGGCGVVYKIDTSGHQSTLFKFEFGPTGWSPNGFLTIDAQGNLYGATVDGGNMALCGGFGCGVIYKLDRAGNQTVIYTFTGGADGGIPSGGLLLDSKGNLYGTAYIGGDLTCTDIPNYSGCGVVFKITPKGREQVLHTFEGFDGAGPSLGLVRDSAGNLYSTTVYGGSANLGAVFSLAPDGTETVLHSFTGGGDGALSWSGLTMDASGNLYGNAEEGGDLSCNPPSGCGTVFKITP